MSTRKHPPEIHIQLEVRVLENILQGAPGAVLCYHKRATCRAWINTALTALPVYKMGTLQIATQQIATLQTGTLLSIFKSIGEIDKAI